MGFSVDEMVAHVVKNGIVKPSLYEVRIQGASLQPDASQEVMFNCSAVNVPGVNVGLFQDTRYGIGLRQMYPTAKNFTEINLTFYESESQLERKFFADWMELIYNRDTRKIAYKKDYAKLLSIIQYDRKGTKIYEAVLLDAFPSNMSPLDKAYNAGETVSQFNVNLQFTDMKERFGPTFEDPSGIL